MEYFFEPPPWESPAPRVARQPIYVDLGALFPESDFWDRACALFLDELVAELRAARGHVQVGCLLEAIREAEPPAWLQAKLYAAVAREAYRRVLVFSETCTLALDFCRTDK